MDSANEEESETDIANEDECVTDLAKERMNV